MHLLFYNNLKKNCTFYKPTKIAYVKTIGKINFNKNFKIEENQPSPKASFTISDANQPQIIQIKRVLKGSKIVDVRKSRESKTVFPKILKFIGDNPIVAHNAIFDYSFINKTSQRLFNKPFDKRYIDTQFMFKEV